MPMINKVIAAVNLAGVLLSIPIIAAGIWLASEIDNGCVQILQWPVLILGIAILVVAIAGLVGALWRLPWLLIFYFIAMLILIILLAFLVAFIYRVTAKGSGHTVPNRAYLEYHLDDYSVWLRRRVQSSYKWYRIRDCLSSTSMCSELNQTYHSAQDFFNASIGSLQSGCCKPPTQCGYTYVSPTNWISPIDTGANPDCSKWRNDQTELCYACNSCKAGLLANLRKEWRRVDNDILVLTLVGLICAYLVGCCVLFMRDTRTEDLFRRYRQGYT